MADDWNDNLFASREDCAAAAAILRTGIRRARALIATEALALAARGADAPDGRATARDAGDGRTAGAERRSA